MTWATEPDVWVVIAAFNEARMIGKVVADVTGQGGRRYRALVVDDGSSDNTATLASYAGAAVVRHPINLGQGAALQTGIAFALESGADVVVTFDADGQHRAGDIAMLVATLNAQAADFVLGSRFLGCAVNMPAARLLLLKAATVFTRLTTGLRVTDAHNGLRAMTRRGAQALRLRQNRMAHASELLHQIAASGLRYVEAAVTIDYSAYSLAKGQRTSDAVAILVDLAAKKLTR